MCITNTCVCTRAHTYIDTSGYNEEWWCLKLVGGLHKKKKLGPVQHHYRTFSH